MKLYLSILSGMLAGVIFDWDGVVADSEEAHRKSWKKVAVELRKELPEQYFEKSFGLKNDRIIPEILQWAKDSIEIKRISDRKEKIFRDLIQEEGIKIFPGVLELLKELEKKGIPCVIASSTPRVNIDVVSSFLGLEQYFSGIISAEDVEHGKPAPDVFLRALEGLGCSRQECIIFEDAPAGIKAGLTAGIKVVGIGTTHEISELVGAHFIVESLAQVKLSDIEGILNEPLA